jgi:threonine dehydrogenase-like Zn-dependent dehydrogenase
MRALMYDGVLRLEQVDTPTLQGDQALLKIRRAGICNTDLELVAGYKNFSGILGHEFVGEVIDGAWVRLMLPTERVIFVS